MARKAKEGDNRIGNQFWKQRSRHGRNRIFATPDILWTEACKYFEWADSTPLMETKAFHNQGKIVMARVPIMRAFTIRGLCLFLNCNELYFSNFKKSLKGKDDDLSKSFSEVITMIEDAIYTQKFEGAAAGLLNANIISRELGLAEKQNIDATTNGKDLPAAPQIVIYGDCPRLASSEEDVDMGMDNRLGASGGE